MLSLVFSKVTYNRAPIYRGEKAVPIQSYVLFDPCHWRTLQRALTKQYNMIRNIIAFDAHEGDYHVRFSFCADLSPRVEDRNGLRYINDKIIRPQRGRTVFSAKQLHELEKVFVNDQYISGQQRRRLSSQLGLTETQVRVWFQNRRIKWRKQKLERKVKAWTGNSLRISLSIIHKGALILYSLFRNKDHLLINSSFKIILSVSFKIL